MNRAQRVGVIVADAALQVNNDMLMMRRSIMNFNDLVDSVRVFTFTWFSWLRLLSPVWWLRQITLAREQFGLTRVLSNENLMGAVVAGGMILVGKYRAVGRQVDAARADKDTQQAVDEAQEVSLVDWLLESDGWAEYVVPLGVGVGVATGNLNALRHLTYFNQAVRSNGAAWREWTKTEYWLSKADQLNNLTWRQRVQLISVLVLLAFVVYRLRKDRTAPSAPPRVLYPSHWRPDPGFSALSQEGPAGQDIVPPPLVSHGGEDVSQPRSLTPPIRGDTTDIRNWNFPPRALATLPVGLHPRAGYLARQMVSTVYDSPPAGFSPGSAESSTLSFWQRLRQLFTRPDPRVEPPASVFAALQTATTSHTCVPPRGDAEESLSTAFEYAKRKVRRVVGWFTGRPYEEELVNFFDGSKIDVEVVTNGTAPEVTMTAGPYTLVLDEVTNQMDPAKEMARGLVGALQGVEESMNYKIDDSANIVYAWLNKRHGDKTAKEFVAYDGTDWSKNKVWYDAKKPGGMAARPHTRAIARIPYENLPELKKKLQQAFLPMGPLGRYANHNPQGIDADLQASIAADHAMNPTGMILQKSAADYAKLDSGVDQHKSAKAVRNDAKKIEIAERQQDFDNSRYAGWSNKDLDRELDRLDERGELTREKEEEIHYARERQHRHTGHALEPPNEIIGKAKHHGRHEADDEAKHADGHGESATPQLPVNSTGVVYPVVTITRSAGTKRSFGAVVRGQILTVAHTFGVLPGEPLGEFHGHITLGDVQFNVDKSNVFIHPKLDLARITCSIGAHKSWSYVTIKTGIKAAMFMRPSGFMTPCNVAVIQGSGVVRHNANTDVGDCGLPIAFGTKGVAQLLALHCRGGLSDQPDMPNSAILINEEVGNWMKNDQKNATAPTPVSKVPPLVSSNGLVGAIPQQ